MRIIARFMDARNTAEGKFLSVLLSVLLVFSFLNVTMFTDYAGADTNEGEDVSLPAEEPTVETPMQPEKAAEPEAQKLGVDPVQEQPTEEVTDEGGDQVEVELRVSNAEVVVGDATFTANATVAVAVGQDLRFTAKAIDDFELSEVKANGKGLIAEDGAYVIPANELDGCIVTVKAVKVAPESEGDAAGEGGTKSEAVQAQPVQKQQVTEEPAIEEATTPRVDIEELYLVPSKYLVSAGDQFTVSARIFPENATYDSVEWSASPEGAAIVTPNEEPSTATVEALKPGTITVSFSAVYSDGSKESTTVEVEVEPVKASSVVISGYDKDYLIKGETIQLSAEVLPDRVVDRSVQWASSDESVATVDAAGKVVTKKQGTATVTATSIDGRAYDEVSIVVYDEKPVKAEFEVWFTNRYQFKKFSVNVPFDGTEVLCSDVVPVTQTLGGVSYVFTGMLKIRGDKGNQPEWNVVKNWNDVYSLRYEDNKLQYRSSADKKWTSVPSLGLCAFYEQVWNSDASNDVKVVVGDWPYGKNDNTGEKKKQIRIRVVDNDSGKEIYDSGAMRYSDGSSGNYGKIKFNCLDSIYEVNRVTVQKNSGAISDVAYNPETGVSVNFDSTKGDEHYVVTAYVGARAFSVSYDLVGGGDSEDFAASQVKPIDGNKVSVSPTTPTKDGFVFGGWQFDGTVYEPGDEFVMPAQDVVLVAKWIPASETITYSATLGGTVTRATELVKKDPSAQTSGSKAIANMQGYKFMGWYEGSQVSPEGYPVSGAEPVSKSESFKPENKAASYKAVFVRVDAKLSGYSGVYDGNDHGVVLESSLLDSPLLFKAEYSNDGGETWSSENPAYKNVEFDSDGNVASRSVKARIVTTVGSIVVWSDSAEITISKRAVTVSANGTRPYNGGVQTLEIAASSVTAGSLAADDSFASGVVGKVKGEAAGTYTEVVEKAASIVRDGVDVSANYEVTVSGSLTITQAEAASYKAAVSLDGWTYGDQAAAEQPSVEGPGAEDYAAPTYTYYKDGEQLDAKPTDAGEYSVTASWAATASLPALTATDTFRISKRAVTVSANGTRPYNGGVQTLEIAASSVTAGSLAADDSFASGVVGKVKGEAAGTYTEVVEKAASIVRDGVDVSANYEVTVSGSLTITQAEAASYKAAVSLDGWTYGDQAAAEQPSVEGPGAEDYAAPTYTYYKDGEQLDAKPTDAGEYSVTASWAATASLPALTATDTFRISKRAVNLSSDSASKPYDGTALTRPDVKVDGDGFVAGEATARATGSVTEVVEGDVANRIEIVRGVKFKESNYNITLTEGTLRILASGVNDVTIDGINGLDGRGIVKTYDGQAVAVVAEAAIRENSTVEYSVDGAWTTQQPTFLNAGTYEVAVRATNPNYETVEKAVTVVINRAPVTGPPSPPLRRLVPPTRP